MPRRKGMMTGSSTRGRGHKKGRGAGLRGGEEMQDVIKLNV